MDRLARVSVPVALTTGTLSVLAAAAFDLRGPVGAYGILLTVTAFLFLPTGFVGAAILRRSPRNRVGWIFLIAGAAMPISVVCELASDAMFVFHDKSIPAPTAFALVGAAVSVFGVPLVGIFGVLLFPDGQLAPVGEQPSRRARVLARVCGGFLIAGFLYAVFNPTLTQTVAENVHNPIGVAPAGILLIAVLLISPVMWCACRHLLERARRTGDPSDSHALTLAARASMVIPAAYFSCLVVGLSGGDTNEIGIVENVATIAIGIASWIGIVRYGLFNVRVVLSRTLLYGALTVAVVVVYVLTSTLLELLFAGTLPRVVAVAIGALAVLPIRDLLQSRVSRLVFGLRDDPVAALGLLGVRLDAAAAPDDVLPAAVQALGEALRLRYAAIRVDDDVLARWGEPVGGALVELDLPFAGESIGQLILQSRDPDEPFGQADRELLDTLLGQVGVAARAVALTHDLERSRGRLIAAREAERRRLRRDLHDGLGPTLAGIALGIDTARRSLPEGMPAISELLVSLRQEAERGVADIRRIAYNLRPPILDELGLAGAVREQAARLGCATVRVSPITLPVLPAAVEVAAYRIALEALTNASRHAPGAPVEIELSVNGRLQLDISDAGEGIGAGARAGVGITSMSDRAAELGGECVVRDREPHGTVVSVWLPLQEVVT